MINVIPVFRIIVSHNIHSLGISRLVRHYHSCESSGSRPGSVYTLDYLGKPFRNLPYPHSVRSIRIVSSIHRLGNGGVVAVKHRV